MSSVSIGWSAYVRSEFQVRDTSLELRVVRVVQVSVDDLLGESKGSVQPDESALIHYSGRKFDSQGGKAALLGGASMFQLELSHTVSSKVYTPTRDKAGSNNPVGDSPGSDNLQVVLDSLVVDEPALLEVAHLDLLVADAALDSGH
jgi:hypothetical protein